MGKPSSGIVLSLAVVVALHSSRALAADDENLSLMVVVDDRAHVRPVTLDQAKIEATRVYRQAGVRILWRDAATASGTDAEDPAPTFTIELIIQTKLLGAARPSSQFLIGAAPATARTCGGAVYVFHDQLTEFSTVKQVDPGLVLGTVVAHEIGHLLLKHSGHSPEGLMRASWDSTDWQRASLGLLLLTAREPERVRATIASCRR